MSRLSAMLGATLCYLFSMACPGYAAVIHIPDDYPFVQEGADAANWDWIVVDLLGGIAPTRVRYVFNSEGWPPFNISDCISSDEDFRSLDHTTCRYVQF